jgi:hypothetical protein
VVAASQQDFSAAVLRGFPELRETLEACDGSLHLEVGEFAAFTQAAKGRGDLAAYERCVKLVDKLLAEADPKLAGELRVSYLEHLEFEGSRGPAAWHLVPPRLQSAWNQAAAENRRLMALPQKRTKPEHPKGATRRDAHRRGRRR